MLTEQSYHIIKIIETQKNPPTHLTNSVSGEGIGALIIAGLGDAGLKGLDNDSAEALVKSTTGLLGLARS